MHSDYHQVVRDLVNIHTGGTPRSNTKSPVLVRQVVLPGYSTVIRNDDGRYFWVCGLPQILGPTSSGTKFGLIGGGSETGIKW